MTSNNFNVNSLAVYLPYSAEVGIGTSNVVNTGSGNLTVGNTVSLLGSSNGSVTLTAPASTNPYTLKLPSLSNGASNLPYSANSLTFTPQGQATFSPAEFTAVLYSADGVAPPNLVTSSFLYNCWATTAANGKATVNLINSSSNALFNTVTGISALAFNQGSNVSSVTLVGGYNLSTDKKSLVITAVQSTNILLGGSTLTTASNIPLSITVTGY